MGKIKEPVRDLDYADSSTITVIFVKTLIEFWSLCRGLQITTSNSLNLQILLHLKERTIRSIRDLLHLEVCTPIQRTLHELHFVPSDQTLAAMPLGLMMDFPDIMFFANKPKHYQFQQLHFFFPLNKINPKNHQIKSSIQRLII